MLKCDCVSGEERFGADVDVDATCDSVPAVLGGHSCQNRELLGYPSVAFVEQEEHSTTMNDFLRCI